MLANRALNPFVALYKITVGKGNHHDEHERNGEISGIGSGESCLERLGLYESGGFVGGIDCAGQSKGNRTGSQHCCSGPKAWGCWFISLGPGRIYLRRDEAFSRRVLQCVVPSGSGISNERRPFRYQQAPRINRHFSQESGGFGGFISNGAVGKTNVSYVPASSTSIRFRSCGHGPHPVISTYIPSCLFFFCLVNYKIHKDYGTSHYEKNMVCNQRNKKRNPSMACGQQLGFLFVCISETALIWYMSVVQGV